MKKKYNETMIIRQGKLLYAISLKDNARAKECSCHIFIENGKVYFSDYIFTRVEFDFTNETHQIAKEIFITQLQADIKRRVLELKQLQGVFAELNLKECFGSVLEDNTKLLLEVKEDIVKVSNTVKEDVKTKLDTASERVKEQVEEAIKETVKPIALKKPKED